MYQSESEATVSAYWKHVMRHRPTCTVAVAQVKASITNVLPDNSEPDSPLHMHSDDLNNGLLHTNSDFVGICSVLPLMRIVYSSCVGDSCPMDEYSVASNSDAESVLSSQDSKRLANNSSENMVTEIGPVWFSSFAGPVNPDPVCTNIPQAIILRGLIHSFARVK